MQTPAGFPEYGVLVKASTMYVFISFFLIGGNNLGYGHLAVSVARNVPFAGALASLIFNSLS